MQLRLFFPETVPFFALLFAIYFPIWKRRLVNAFNVLKVTFLQENLFKNSFHTSVFYVFVHI